MSFFVPLQSSWGNYYENMVISSDNLYKQGIIKENPNEPPKGYKLLKGVTKLKVKIYFLIIWKIVCSKFNSNYSDETKNRIIQMLKRERAFNADSALKIEDENDSLICEDLADKEIIKQIDDRFWFEG